MHGKDRNNKQLFGVNMGRRTKEIVLADDIAVSTILKALEQKRELKIKREEKVKESREIRKAIYNLSQEINGLEEKIDKYLVEKVLKK